MRILIISDGKAGHVSSSKGMAQLIAQKIASETHILDVGLRAKILRPVLRFLINSGGACRLSGLFGEAWIKLFYRGYRPMRADVVISAGGDTLYLNAYAGRCLDIPNFFCGSMRGVHPSLFRLIVHTRRASLPNWRAMAVLPIALDLEKANQAAAEFSSGRLAGKRKNLWALMIGGKGNGYGFSDTHMVAMLEQCASLASQHGKTLLLTTSRRTGQSAETALAAWLAKHPEAPITYAVLYGQRPEKIAGAFMRLAEVIFCSEESTSMISESVFCGRPVVTLAPTSSRPVQDQQDFLAELEERRHIQRTQIGRFDKDAFEDFLKNWRPYGGEEHRELQAMMLAELPGRSGIAPSDSQG
jgi:mitochondrial fission protein ELM1